MKIQCKFILVYILSTKIQSEMIDNIQYKSIYIILRCFAENMMHIGSYIQMVYVCDVQRQAMKSPAAPEPCINHECNVLSVRSRFASSVAGFLHQLNLPSVVGLHHQGFIHTIFLLWVFLHSAILDFNHLEIPDREWQSQVTVSGKF